MSNAEDHVRVVAVSIWHLLPEGNSFPIWFDVRDLYSVSVSCSGGGLTFPRVQLLLRVCETVTGSAGDEAGLSSSTSVTNAESAIPASFFVPWKVLNVYRFRPFLSFRAKACSRQIEGPRCCVRPGMAAPCGREGRRSGADCRRGVPFLRHKAGKVSESPSDEGKCSGAPGRTRTCATGSGGRCSIR